jgi:diguanylate cyclase (GGDEF)-like protein
VLVLGLLLAGSYRSAANGRGLAEARSQAAILTRTAIAPILDGANLSRGLTPAETKALDRMSKAAISTKQVIRLRLRSLAGRVVYATDPASIGQRPDDEALDAVRGSVVSELTRLNADPGSHDVSGFGNEKAVEVYRPVYATNRPTREVGVLEVYLPDGPIAADVTAGLGALYRDLGVGLGVLYVLLAGISFSATRRLRAQVARNAHLAEHDALTGLPNRALFHRRVEEAIAAADEGEHFAVAVIDLDRFKEVNDTLGHGNGDALLSELSARLADAVGGTDTVARLGGDEFGLVLNQPGAIDDVRAALIQLRGLLQQDVEVRGLPLAVEASIGFAMAPEDGTTVDALLQHADVAMYVAKATHAGVVRYDSSQDHYDSGKLALVAELKHAIDSDQLLLHYQPKASVSSRDIVAVEALVRWNHPDRGLLYPDAFLDIAEQTGIIDALTRWVLHNALEQLKAWGPEFGDLSVAINVSARNLARADFADGVLREIAQSRVSPDRVLLEITETALVTDPDRAGRSLRRLAAAGVRISLDDFGRGQTSLGYLSTLPLHEVKIDKSFVSDMLDDHSHAAIVRSVIDLAHNLGFEVVAEGVETEQILAELTSLGCDIAQGYLLAKPMPPAVLPNWVLGYRVATDAADAAWAQDVVSSR